MGCGVAMRALDYFGTCGALGGFVMLLREFLETHYLLRPRVQSERTREFYRHEVAKLDAYHLGPVALSELSEALVLGACQSQVGRSRSLATVQKFQTAILAIWRYAYRRRKAIRVEVPQVPEFERWPVYQKEPECFSADDVSAILSAAVQTSGTTNGVPNGVFFAALILVAYESGARISAIMQARWDDLGGDGLLRFRAEAAKDRAEARAYLSDQTMSYLEQLPRVDPTIFGCWPWDRGKGHHWRALNRALADILTRAGFKPEKGVRFHKFRRTFATLLASKLGESVAQSLLGHSSIRVTRRYIDKSKLDLPHACDVLPTPTISKGFKVCG